MPDGKSCMLGSDTFNFTQLVDDALLGRKSGYDAPQQSGQFGGLHCIGLYGRF